VGSFALFDCNLARYAAGRSCSNLRELLEALRSAPDMVLEHHMMRCALDDPFELYEFPNDLARWCWDALGDRVLAEELGLVDPYQLDNLSAVRAALVNVIEERLWGSERSAPCLPGLELHLVGSRLIAFDTGDRFPTMTAFAEALPRMSLRSLYYHFHEARRRRQGQDDVSDWLQGLGADPNLISRVKAIDFYFLNLQQLRVQFIDIFRTHVAEPNVVLKELK
jgi:Family of unknown function (DUF5752)